MNDKRSNRRSFQVMIGLVLMALIVTGCSTGMHQQTAKMQENQLEDRWGIRPVALRLIGSDHFIDFRYRVIDPEKAMELLSRNNTPYLIDETSGKVHTVPVTKLGPMRASAVKPKANRNYVVLFGNTQKIIQQGSRVTVVIGDFKAEHLEVM